MAWEIEWQEDAAKEFRKLNRTIQREIWHYLTRRILRADHPRQFGKALKGSKAGLWRYRITDYRIVCRIDEDRESILILRVAHRRQVYQ